MFRRFSVRDLTRVFSTNAFERGRGYFEEGRVRHLDVKQQPGGVLAVRGEVQGSGGRSYQQEVDLEWADDELDVFSTCSCPVGFDCKHVVAVCLMVRRYLAGGIGATDQETVDARLRRWLQRVAEAGDADRGGPRGERLIYVLLPREERSAGLGLELRLVRPRRQGGYGKGRLVRLHRILDAVERPDWLRAEDEEVARLVLGLCPEFWDQRPDFRGRLGYLALERMLATRRCVFQSAANAPLGWGDERELTLAWHETEDGRLGLDLSAGNGAWVLATDPPVYVDPEAGQVGRLGSELRPEQLAELLAAPALLAGDALSLARLLTNEFPALPMPVPPDTGPAAAERHPMQPRLTLAGRGAGAGRQELRLEFLYGGHPVPPRPKTLQSLVETVEGPLRLHRDLDAEARAADRLTALGFEQQADWSSLELRFISTGESDVEAASRWSLLLHEVVPQLEREGWLVRRHDSFRMRFAAGDWHGEVAPSDGGNDWFSLGFDLEVDGQRVPLLPLLMPLLALGFERPLPARVSLPLPGAADDGSRYVDLPGERLAPFLDTLRELFDSERLRPGSEALAITRFDAALLERLADQGTRVEAPRALTELGRRLASFDGIRPVPPPAGLNATLRGYQQRGLDWLQFLREYELGGILADDMGLGKTLQTLAHLLVEKQSGRLDRPALIVAPTSLMGNWRREAQRFAPDLAVLVLQGPGRHADFERAAEHDLLLTTYPLLPRDRAMLQARAYHVLILDEAQTVKNPRSKAAQAVRALDARHRLCLTGTPMENHLGELWAQLDFLLPGFLGDEEQFRRHWRQPIEEHGDEARQARLARRVAPFVLRRRKADVLTELPPKTEILRTVALGERQAALYESVRLAMDDKVRRAIAAQGLARSHITILDALLKLRQICCDPRLLPFDAGGEVNTSAKLDLLMQILPSMLEEGRRVLLFSQFTRMLALIEAELEQRGIRYSLLTGQTRDRDAALDRFRSGGVDLLLISLKAGGVGLNLTEADTVILYDPWWNPAVEDQAADRAHRIGQERAVFVYKLITEGTVEEKILALQARKRALADGVLAAPGAGEGVAFGADELRELLSADPAHPHHQP